MAPNMINTPMTIIMNGPIMYPMSIFSMAEIPRMIRSVPNMTPTINPPWGSPKHSSL